MRSPFLPVLVAAQCVALFLWSPAVAGGAPPEIQHVRFHGFLYQDGADPGGPANGTFSLSFALLDAAVDGTVLASDGPITVQVVGGRYIVPLEFAADDFGDADRFIAITVDGEPIAPLARVVRSPFGFLAQHVQGPEVEESLPLPVDRAELPEKTDELTTEDFEDVEGRYLDWLALHADGDGFLRPDLWRRAVEQTKTMEVAAWTRTRSLNRSGVTGVQWVQVGPEPLEIDKEQNFQGSGPDSGEVLDVAIDPRNTADRIIYIATNQGGIWKSTDSGSTWKPKTDYMPSLSTGAVALHPGNPSIVYAGTGNLFDGGGVVQLLTKAVGLYRSVDAGETWTVLNPLGIFSNNGIHRIVFPPADAADPPGADVVLVATLGGLFRSVDGGQSFGAAPSFTNGAPVLAGFITDLKLDTTATGTVHAAQFGNGIFRSTDSGRTFPTNLFTTTNGAPDPTTNLRFIWFDQSTSPDNQTLYASVQGPDPGAPDTCRSGRNFVLAKSTDYGQNWVALPDGNARATGNCCQCGYDQTVGVDPVDEDRVYIAFQEMFCSDDGGASFSGTACTRDKTHWDHHAITFSPPGHRTAGDDTTRIWTGTDGGVHYSNDGGSSWANKNETISTNILFHMDMGRGSATNNDYIYGGCQDTGTIHTRPAYGKRWHLSIDGDGQGVAVDPSDPLKAYGGGNNGYFKTTDGGDNWGGTAGGPPGSFRQIVDRNDGRNVYVITGSSLYQSTDTGSNFTLIRSSNSGGNFRAMDMVALDSNTMWLTVDCPRDANGNCTGGRTLEYTENLLAGAASSWTVVTVPGAPNQVPIGVAIDPLNADQVAVVYPGYCGGACAAGNRTRHVFWTTDQGQTWTDISGTDGGGTAGDLPDLPVMSVVIDSATNPPSIIASTITGVMRTSNLGASWQKLGLGLPLMQARTLQIDPSLDPPVLRVGTYGRSVFSLDAAQGPLLSLNTDLAFGPVCLGGEATRQVQMFNVGSEDLSINAFFRAAGSTDFAILSGPSTPVTIPAGHELDWTVRYRPTTAGDASATLQINSNDQFEPTRTLAASGIGAVQDIATVIADSGSFGDVCVGEFRDLDLTITNAGSCTLSLSGINSSNPSVFKIPGVMAFPLSIAPGDSMAVPIRFEPTAVGPETATISISSNDPDTPTKNIAVSGNVPQGDFQVAIADSGNFGEVCAGDFADLNLTLFNQGKCNLTIESIAVDDPHFLLPDDTEFPLVLSPDADFNLPIRFEPGTCSDVPITGGISIDTDELPMFADGFESGDLSAWQSGKAKTWSAKDKTIQLSGVAPCPNLVIDPAALSDLYAFPPTVVDVDGTLGCFSEKSLVLRNSSVCPLTISGMSATGADYSVTAPTQFPLLLPSGEETLEVTVRFTPQADANLLAPSEVTGLLTISSDDPDPHQADLCGESAAQSGVRLLVTETSSGEPLPVDSVDAITIDSKGQSTPSPVRLRFTDQPFSAATVCGREILYHVDQETLPTGDTTGSNPKSSYEATAKEGNLQTSQSFELGQCELREFQLQLFDSGSPTCELLPKGASCTTDGECCSNKCTGPSGGKKCQ